MGPQMRLLFLATSTVAIVVMFYGQASAEQFQADAKILPGSTAPLESTFSENPMRPGRHYARKMWPLPNSCGI